MEVSLAIHKGEVTQAIGDRCGRCIADTPGARGDRRAQGDTRAHGDTHAHGDTYLCVWGDVYTWESVLAEDQHPQKHANTLGARMDPLGLIHTSCAHAVNGRWPIPRRDNICLRQRPPETAPLEVGR